MLWSAILSWWGYLLLGGRLVRAVVSGPRQGRLRRAAIFLPAWLAFGLLNLVHWLGFALDEIFFPGYRNVQVRRPVFICGIPRSGTTHLQRVLAADEAFTTLTLFECVIAPSVTERHAWRFLRRWWPGAGARVLDRATSAMADVHTLGLDEPEEDFLLLLWIQACFLAVIACPDSAHYWRLGWFDEVLPYRERRWVLAFYRRLVQKHLYFHGPDRRLLSKNPSFTPMIESLSRAFPDASFIACVREPARTVPSQLSSLLPAFRLLGTTELDPAFRGHMVDLLVHYYNVVERLHGRVLWLPMASLRDSLVDTVMRIFRYCDHTPSAGYQHGRIAAVVADFDAPEHARLELALPARHCHRDLDGARGGIDDGIHAQDRALEGLLRPRVQRHFGGLLRRQLVDVAFRHIDLGVQHVHLRDLERGAVGLDGVADLDVARGDDAADGRPDLALAQGQRRKLVGGLGRVEREA